MISLIRPYKLNRYERMLGLDRKKENRVDTRGLVNPSVI